MTIQSIDWSDPSWDNFTVPATQRYLEAVRTHGGVVAAAQSLDLAHSTVSQGLSRLARARARVDPTLHARSAPESYQLRGVSTLLDANGNVKQTWVKTQQDNDRRLELLREALAEVVENHRGKLDPLPDPGHGDEDLWAVYPWADAHIGLYAWAPETREDNWDVKIAVKRYRSMTGRLIAMAPPAATGVLLNLGDFFHADGVRSETTNGTPQDTDGRWYKIAKAGVGLTRWAIDQMLSKHRRVKVVVKPGNHDESVLTMLLVCLAALYEREPRVEVVEDPAKVTVLEHGQNLIAAAHGDKRLSKLEDLPGVIAARWPEEWGRTRHRLAYTGHLHDDRVIPDPGMPVEILRTATPDGSWAALKFVGQRDLKCDVWHARDGRVARIIQGLIRP